MYILNIYIITYTYIFQNIMKNYIEAMMLYLYVYSIIKNIFIDVY